MNLNYVLLPENYIPRPQPADTANDDDMDVDEVPMGEPMEVDGIDVRPEQQVIPVTVRVLLPAGKPMEVDSVPAQPWPRPAWYVHAADYIPAQPWPVLPRPAWNIDVADYAPTQPWPVLPRPAWNVDMADCAKISPALIVGGTRVSRRSPRKPSPRPRNTAAPVQRSAPSSPKMAKPVVGAHPHVDMSKIATSSKVKLEDMPLLFSNVATSSGSLNGANHVETDTRVRKTWFSSPLSPVKQSKTDDKLFLTSNRQSPDLITNDGWLKISRTPGRNIGNESVFEGCSGANYSWLAAAYPPTHSLFPEITRFSPVRPTRIDEDFFHTSNRQTPDLAVNNRWLRISRTPDHNIYNESTTIEDDDADYSSLSLAYPPSEDTEDSLPEIDFAEADTSLNWGFESFTPETPRRIRRTNLFSPLSPVRQSKLDDDDLFITSKRQTPDLITNGGWLKTSRTPGRNIHNESVFCDDEYADYSYLAVAYPLIEESHASLDEDYTSTPTSLAFSTSGYLADDSFSFFDTPHSSSPSLAGNDSFGYLADVSCFSLANIPEISDVMDDHSSCENVSVATSQTDLSSSTGMDLLIATMSNLVIDEGSDLEEGIANESAADNLRTRSEDSVAWQTAEERTPRDEDAADEVVESFGEEGSDATQSGHEGSTEEDSFDSHYPSSLSSGNRSSCSCSPYAFSNHVNVSGINLTVSSGSAGSGVEAELLDDFALLAVEEIRWEYEEDAHEVEDGEVQPSNGSQLLPELTAGAEVNGEDDEQLAYQGPLEPGNETELDVNELEDDLKYIYTLPY